ncbi:MAG: TrmH family RNA methyltransferase [Dehalococcoidia bacterium]
MKAAVRLRERRHRDREGLMLVEGRDELTLALDAGVRPVTLFATGEHAGSPLAERCAQLGADVLEVTEEVFAKLAYREHPDGWVAVARIPETTLERIEAWGRPLILVVDGVEKPGNLGAMLRTADAAGATAVILSDAGTDPFNPNVVRASKGTVFSVPLAVADANGVIEWLRERDIAIVVATPESAALYSDADLSGSVALVVGAEDTGVSGAWREAARVAVTIPMAGRVNSLNVATAAALLLYEAVRQRSASR